MVEDMPQEREIAKKRVEALNFIPIMASNLSDGLRLIEKFKDKLYAVVTDLHFPSMSNNDKDKDKPNGLAVISFCVQYNIRVAVCSNVDGHFANYIRHPLKVLEAHQFYSHNEIPLSIRKEWHDVINEVINL